MRLTGRQMQSVKKKLDRTITELASLSLQMGLTIDHLRGGGGQPNKAKRLFKAKQIGIWQAAYTRTIAELQEQANSLIDEG